MSREELNRVLCDCLRALNEVEDSLGATVRWENDLRRRLRAAIGATQATRTTPVTFKVDV